MTDEERVRELLGEVFAVDPPTTSRLTEDRVRSGHRRRRAMATAASASSLVLVVAAVLVLPGLVGGQRGAGPAQAVVIPTPSASRTATPTAAPTAAPSAVRPSLTVAAAPVVLPARPLADGDVVGANGGVVAIPGRPVRWCPGGFSTDESAVAYVRGAQPPAQWCAVGVDVTGVDLDRL